MPDLQLKKPLVILTGISEYDEKETFNPLKQASTNVSKLKELFLLNLKMNPKNVVILSQTESQKDFTGYVQYRKKIKELEKLDFDSVIYYYSGHGVVDDKNKYYLALKETESGFLSQTAIDVERHIEDLCLIADKKPIIFIFDSCFSVRIQDVNIKTGDFLILSSVSKRNAPSIYPTDKEYSVFTQAFITAVTSLIQKGEPKIYFQSIFDELVINIKNRCEKDNREYPEPSPLDRKILSNHAYLSTPSFKEDKDKIALELLECLADKDDSVNEIIINLQTLKNPLVNEVASRFPTTISNTLIKIIATPDELTMKNYFNYYEQIIKFIVFNLIIDTTTNEETISDELKLLLNQLTQPTHQIYSDILFQILKDEKIDFFKNDILDNVVFFSKVTEINNLIKDENVSQNLSKYELRRHIIDLIKSLSFLTDYRWIAIRSINVHKHYKVAQYFMHQYSNLLGGQPEEYKDGIKLKSTLYSSSIIVGKLKQNEHFNESTPYLNLWPFIIDKNSFFQISSTEENETDTVIYKSSYGKHSLPSIYFYSKINNRDIIFDDMREEKNGHKYKDIHQTLPPNEYKQNFDYFLNNILHANSHDI